MPSACIPGTILFDGVQARKGYALNKMCFSFNDESARAAFRQDPEAYMASFGLNAVQCDAVRRKDVLAMLEAGGNVYYLAKLAGIWGLDVQDLGAAQTGLSKDAFKARLVAQNAQPVTPRPHRAGSAGVPAAMAPAAEPLAASPAALA